MKKFVIDLSKRAGNLLLKNFRKDYDLFRLRGTSKEIVTKYDKMSDEMIVKALIKKFPEYNIITEESGLRNKNSEFTWIVDSLDGSSNFAAGNPFFSISIALLHYDKPILGVAYAPFLKELFVAEEGKGSLLNGKIIHVSDIEKLEKSYFVWCEGAGSNLQMSKINSILHPIIKDLRKLGSGSLECAWVASGRAEVYVTTQIEPWDVAAGVILVLEAGGKVTNFKGDDWKPVRTDFISSNTKVHNDIIEIMKNIE